MKLHYNDIVSPNFKLTKFRLDDKVDGIFLNESNVLWNDELISITILY